MQLSDKPANSTAVCDQSECRGRDPTPLLPQLIILPVVLAIWVFSIVRFLRSTAVYYASRWTFCSAVPAECSRSG